MKTGHGCTTTSFTYLIGAWTMSDKPDTSSQHWDHTHLHHEVLKVWDQIWQDLGGLSCDMSNDRSYMLPSIPYILWVHAQGLAILCCHQYNQIPPIHTMKMHANQHAIIWVVSVMIWWITGHWCVATHSVDLLCIDKVYHTWGIITLGSHTYTL